MTVLTAGAIADVAYSAGFRGEALATSVAVALAESGGDSGARGDINLTTGGEVSVGLWQINWRPAYASDPARNREANLDPATAARNAYTISGGGTNFRPWSTFTNGRYRSFLPAAQSASAGVAARGGALAPPASPSAADSGVPIGPPDPRIPGGGFPVGQRSTSADVGVPDAGQLLASVYVAPVSTEHIILEGFGEGDDHTTERLSARVTGGDMSMSVSEVSQLTLTLLDPDRRLGRRGLLRNGAPLVWARPGGPRDAEGRREFPWDGQVAGHEVIGDDPLTWKITSRSAGAQMLRHGELFAAASAKNASLTEYAAQLATAVGLGITGQGLPRLGDIAPALEDAPGANTGKITESPWDVLQRLAEDQGVWVWEAAGHLYVGKPTWLIDRLVTVPVTVETGRVTDCVGLPHPRDSIDATGTGVTLELSLPRWRGELVRPGMTLAVTWPEWLSNYPARYLVASVSWPVDGGVAPVSLSCVEPVDPAPKTPPGAAGANDTPATASETPGPSAEQASGRPSAASAAGLVWPLAGKVTGRFGDYRAGPPVHSHEGIDIGVPIGTPVRAATAGKVTRISGGPSGAAGLYLEVTRDDGLLTRYLHLSKTSSTVGDEVSQGQVICYSGNTGTHNSGPHLHFEVRPGGAAQDPLKFLPPI